MSELPLRYEIRTVLADGRPAGIAFEFANEEALNSEPGRTGLLQQAFRGLTEYAKDPEAAQHERDTYSQVEFPT